MNIPDVPKPPAIPDNREANIDELRQEVQDLRNWAGLLYMSIKTTETRMGDIAVYGEKVVKDAAKREKDYVELSNKVDKQNEQISDLREDVDLMIEALEAAGIIPPVGE